MQISQRLGQCGGDLHHVGDRGMPGHAVAARVLDVDRLPDDGNFFRIKGRIDRKS